MVLIILKAYHSLGPAIGVDRPSPTKGSIVPSPGSDLLVAVIYLPFLTLALGTFSLALADWLVVTGVALTIFPVLELAKWLERRGWFGAAAEGSSER